MDINYKSSLNEVLQAISGTWDVSVSNDWKCLEMSNIRIFKKILTKGSNVLPQKFLNYRNNVTPVILFTKDGIKGQTIDLQQNAIVVEENCICLIIDF